MGNTAREQDQEPVKHEAHLSDVFTRDHTPSSIFP